jgi:RHS repeat-associated protein
VVTGAPRIASGTHSGNANVVQLTDYHEFGQTMEGRNTTLAYRYGYQGSEQDRDILNTKNSYYTTEFRMLDVRLGRWFMADPITQAPWSPYTSMNDNPVGLTDVRGLKAGDPPVSGPDQGCDPSCASDIEYAEWRIDHPGDIYGNGSTGLGGSIGGNVEAPLVLIKLPGIKSHNSGGEAFRNWNTGGTAKKGSEKIALKPNTPLVARQQSNADVDEQQPYSLTQILEDAHWYSTPGWSLRLRHPNRNNNNNISVASIAQSIKNTKNVKFAGTHPSGIIDDANAQDNINDVANGNKMYTSTYGHGEGKTVGLNEGAASAFLILAKKYKMEVSEIAGGKHTSGRSYHYKGKAFDVNFINDVHVTGSSETVKAFIKDAEAAGFSVGEEYDAHHLHLQWNK